MLHVNHKINRSKCEARFSQFRPRPRLEITIVGHYRIQKYNKVLVGRVVRDKAV